MRASFAWTVKGRFLTPRLAKGTLRISAKVSTPSGAVDMRCAAITVPWQARAILISDWSLGPDW
jgi:hypothetical protein